MKNAVKRFAFQPFYRIFLWTTLEKPPFCPALGAPGLCRLELHHRNVINCIS
ncbi:MAG: hypothetical protein VB085_00235 [Peptococcaceae bacterium]|nr:hypothetical protein [Peptococcaceae bacterium]